MRFTPTHEWITVKEGIGTVGITQYAQNELGAIVYVELPTVGKVVSAGEEIAVLESTKAAADIYTPVSGIVVEVNERVRESTGTINEAAESQGWLFKIQLSNLSEIEHLLDHRHYQELVT